MKNLIKYGFIAVVSCFYSCSEISTKSEAFTVTKVYVKGINNYDYKLKPVKGLGVLVITSKNFYNLGDTLTIKPNCN